MKKFISIIPGWIAIAATLLSCHEKLPDPLPFTPSTSVPSEEITEVKLLFTGDIMAHLPQIQAAYQKDYESYDFHNNYKYIRHLIQDADLAIGNLETTIPGKGPYRGYPQFTAPSDLLAALKNTGFDILCTANNHSNDSYGRGLISTIEHIGLYGMSHVGTYRDSMHKDQEYPLILLKNDIKIAILNHSYSTNGIPDTEPTIVNRIDTADIREAYLKAKSEEADFIIACMHWGLEYKLQESGSQRKIARFLADLGVDLIIGSHPHVIQPIKYIQASSGDSVLCAFSLGNLISNQKYPNTDGGLIFETRLEKNKHTQQVLITDYGHRLHWRYKAPATKQSPRGEYYILPQDVDAPNYIEELNMAPAAIKQMDAFVQAMRTHLSAHPAAKEIRTVSDEISLQ